MKMKGIRIPLYFRVILTVILFAAQVPAVQSAGFNVTDTTIIADHYFIRYIANDSMVANLCVPIIQGKAPCVIFLGGTEGGIPFDKMNEKQYNQGAGGFENHLLKSGIAVLNLAYFKAGNLSQAVREVPLEIIWNALTWLSKQEKIDAAHIGITGGSKGGELALLAGAEYAQIKAAVSILGSGVVWQGISTDPYHPVSSWTKGGIPYPFVKYSYPSGFINNRIAGKAITHEEMFQLFVESMSKNLVPEAIIKVEKIKGPVMLISSEDDNLWPSAALCDIAYERLKTTNHPYAFQHLKGKGLQHGISSELWLKAADFLIEALQPVGKTP